MEDQLTIDDYLEVDSWVEPELLHCQLSEGFHWMRISRGHTPDPFKKYVEFELDGYEYLYKDTPTKDGILTVFSGRVKVVDWQNAI